MTTLIAQPASSADAASLPKSYLIRFRSGQRSAMHEHLCFPPSAGKRDVGLPRAA